MILVYIVGLKQFDLLENIGFAVIDCSYGSSLQIDQLRLVQNRSLSLGIIDRKARPIASAQILRHILE
jgi:hypothetical protein